MTKIDLNCDMGEGIGNDAAIMPYISSANIACGYHAGNQATMNATVELAITHNVAIGAHPGFKDKANFGRTEQLLSTAALYDLVTTQVYAMYIICKHKGAVLRHVKPHGALYNMAAASQPMSAIIAQAVKDVDDSLCLYGLSNSYLLSEATAAGLRTAAEVFADRTYQDDGALTPRKQPGALITSEAAALAQVLQMVQQQTVTTTTGKVVPISADTICLHGDGKHAAAFAKLINQTLTDHQLIIRYP